MPTREEEAVRDLVRLRGTIVIDRTRAHHRLSKFLLRHGHVYRGGVAWTLAHETMVAAHLFRGAALASTYAHYRAIVTTVTAELDAVERDLRPYDGGWTLR